MYSWRSKIMPDLWYGNDGCQLNLEHPDNDVMPEFNQRVGDIQQGRPCDLPLLPGSHVTGAHKVLP